MPLFVIMGLDEPKDLKSKRDTLRPTHNAYVAKNVKPVTLAAPLFDSGDAQCGSFYIFEADNEQQVRDWFKDEPFTQAGVYKDLIIHRIELRYNQVPQRKW